MRYDHIIGLPHHVSKKHKPMSMMSRAAQFASFKALTGFEEEIGESARLTECRHELDEMQLTELDRAFALLEKSGSEQPLIEVTWFRPDERKEGGEYVSFRGNFRFLDIENRRLRFTDNTNIPLSCIVKLEFVD